jgi:glycosyltransferase involved in cell wall biosynthesis
MKIDLVCPQNLGHAAGNLDSSSVHAQVDGLRQQLTDHGQQVQLRALPEDAMEGLSSAVSTLSEAWSDEQPDVIHAHLWTSGLASLAALRDLSALGSTPIVLTFHTVTTDGPEHTHRPEWQRLKAAVARGVDRVAASSRRELSNLAILGVHRRDVDIIPPAVDIDHFTPGPPANADPDVHRLLALGPMTPDSGFDLAIRAMAGIPRAELVIAAAPPTGREEDWARADDAHTRHLLSIAHRVGVEDSVHIIDMPGRRELPGLLRSADVVVSTPLRDTAGTAELEAMACGRPVVGTAVGDLIDIVLDGTTGALIDQREPAALAHAINTLLGDPVRLDGFGLAAAERAQARYTWPRIAAEITHSYERVLPS